MVLAFIEDITKTREKLLVAQDQLLYSELEILLHSIYNGAALNTTNQTEALRSLRATVAHAHPIIRQLHSSMRRNHEEQTELTRSDMTILDELRSVLPYIDRKARRITLMARLFNLSRQSILTILDVDTEHVEKVLATPVIDLPRAFPIHLVNK